MPPAPELPTTLFDAILAVVPKLWSTSFTSLRHFPNLIQVLPRPASQSSFCSALVTLAKLHPRAVYAAFDRLAIQLDRDTANPDALAQTIRHLAPALRMPLPVILTFDLASEKPPSNKHVFSPKARYATLASALVLGLYAHGKVQAVDYLISQRWTEKSMWAEALLHYLILNGDGAGLEWWDTLKYPVPASFPWTVLLPALSGSHIKALEWLIERSIDLGKSLFPNFGESWLMKTGVCNGSPQFMDRIWSLVSLSNDELIYSFSECWILASTSSQVGNSGNIAMLDWAAGRGIVFPEPEEMRKCLDGAVSVQVLDWWQDNYLSMLETDDLGYSTKTLDSATRAGSVDKLNWWMQSGLELRFSPQAIEAAKGKPELEAWWENCLQYKMLSGAISVGEAAAAGIAPCRNWETLCAWGRMDLMEAVDIDSRFEQERIPPMVTFFGIVAACKFGHIDILDRFCHVIVDSQESPGEVGWCDWVDDWVLAAAGRSQLGALEWLRHNGFTKTIDSRYWGWAAGSAIRYDGGGVLDVLEWMHKHDYLSLPASEHLVSRTLRPQVHFPAMHRLWKLGGGLGVYSFGVTDGAIRMAIDANCQEMIQWWLEKQGDILHPLHVEMLQDALE